MTLAGFGVLLAAGLLSAAFDAPVGASGVYDIEAMRGIPYGEWYLAILP